MATKLTHSATANSVSTVAIAFAAEPVGGFNATAALAVGSATVDLQVRVGAEWMLADTLVFPHPTTGERTLNVPVYPPYAAARWNISAISGGGTLNLDAIGVGV